MAIISGVTQSTLNNIVSGRNNSATVSTLKKLCDGLEISISDFFDRRCSPTSSKKLSDKIRKKREHFG